MTDIDPRAREAARQLAEGISSRLDDGERAKMLEMAQRMAEGALKTFDDPLGALRAKSFGFGISHTPAATPNSTRLTAKNTLLVASMVAWVSIMLLSEVSAWPALCPAWRNRLIE